MKNLTQLTTTLLLATVGLTQFATDVQAQPSTDLPWWMYYERAGGFGRTLATGDFNGDGYWDQVVGDPTRDYCDHNNNWVQEYGSVTVRFSNSAGLSEWDQVWTADSPGIDHFFGMQTRLCFGVSLGVGDFNGDGYHDLAIGVPNSFERTALNGAVLIMYGSTFGLTTQGARMITQDTYGVAGVCEYLDYFGEVLAAGDFNRDGCDDLVVGVPGEDIGDKVNAGIVHVFWGKTSGLSTASDLCLHQDNSGVPGKVEEYDSFGEALAVGDFNGDSYDDLAVGVPREDLPGYANFGFGAQRAGMVNLFQGHAGGLKASSKYLKQGTYIPGLSNSDLYAEDRDFFGLALQAGDLNGDGRDELVVGIPGEDIGGCYNYVFESLNGSVKQDAGAIQVYYFRPGQNFSLTIGGLFYTQDTPSYLSFPGIAGVSEGLDYFGATLATGDLNGDGYDDVVVGNPGEDIGSIGPSAGSVNILYGNQGLGITTTGNFGLYQNSAGVPLSCDSHDQFGDALSVCDLDGDGYAELTVGVPGETVTGHTYQYPNILGPVRGAIQVFEGSSSGPRRNAETWYSHD